MTVNTNGPKARTDVIVGDAAEPLLTRAVIVSVGTVLLGIAVTWGLKLTQAQQDMTLTALGVFATIGAAWWARRHVNSPATTKAALDHSRPRSE